MTTTHQQNADNGNSTFGFDCGDHWLRFSADFGQLCQNIGEQVRRAAAQIDVDSVLVEVRRAADDIAAEARQAAENFRSSSGWNGPTRVRVDIRADAPDQPTGRAQQPDLAVERKAVLDLLAQGKINAQEAARLLDALGN